MIHRPVRLARPSRRVSRDAGSYRGSISGWRPPYAYSLEQQARERALSQDRASDLVANDWAAKSGVDAITTNAIGTGLKPQSHLDAKRLGITTDQAEELQCDIERVWQEWSAQAHVRGMLHFEDLQFLGLRTMLRSGELLHLPVMLSDADAGYARKIKLAIQDVQPSRLRTPLNLISDTRVVDGIEQGPFGRPEGYWLATPHAALSHTVDISALSSDQFTRIPARVGHRPGCFHLFCHTEEEQTRGESVLSAGLKMFRHLSDSVDNEMLAQVVTASMSMFISREDGNLAPPWADEGSDEDGRKFFYEEVQPGTVLYGNKNEKPYPLELSRPSPNFPTFCEFVIRAMAASIGIPYEVLLKDFSKTNYSSARAALLEAWRVFVFYRSWFTRHYCQPIWGMVLEEAWLTGLLKFPAAAPDFYDAMGLYTKAIWIGPSRGYIDPVKETASIVTMLENRLMTYSEALAERGRDFDEVMDERAAEEARLAKFTTQPTKPSTFNAPKEEKEEAEHA